MLTIKSKKQNKQKKNKREEIKLRKQQADDII